MEASGFGPSMKKNPKVVLESKGVQEELAKRGFHPDIAREVVGEILLAGENDSVKLKAADMVFKVHGSYAAEKHLNLNVEVDADPIVERLTEHLNGIYKGTSLSGDGTSPRALDHKASD